MRCNYELRQVLQGVSNRNDRRTAIATLLANGKVLLVGGSGSTSAELYDPTTGTFSATGSTAEIRNLDTATLLANGKVLIVGGSPGDGALPPQPARAELYDLNTGAFTSTGTPTAAHYAHAAALLSDRKVLISGGLNGCWESDGNIRYQSECAIAATELYDPATNGHGIHMTGRFSHTATLLPNGRVLIAAGNAYPGTPELYDPATGAFSVTGTMDV